MWTNSFFLYRKIWIVHKDGVKVKRKEIVDYLDDVAATLQNHLL